MSTLRPTVQLNSVAVYYIHYSNTKTDHRVISYTYETYSSACCLTFARNSLAELTLPAMISLASIVSAYISVNTVITLVFVRIALSKEYSHKAPYSLAVEVGFRYGLCVCVCVPHTVA